MPSLSVVAGEPAVVACTHFSSTVLLTVGNILADAVLVSMECIVKAAGLCWLGNKA